MEQIYASSQSEIPAKASKGEVSYPVGSPNYVPWSETHVSSPQQVGSTFRSGIPLTISDNIVDPYHQNNYQATVMQDSVRQDSVIMTSVPEPATIIYFITGAIIVSLWRRYERRKTV